MTKLCNTILLLSNYKRSFWEELKYEVNDLFETIIEFFTDIYNSLFSMFGSITNLFLIAIGALALMLILIKVIGR
ncbi:MAG: hypothetical protein ACI4WW_07090 [Candidatus Coprovivens sp.]